MRYFVASLLTPSTDQRLRQFYRQTFDADCPVKTLHLTFIPPFTIDLPHTLAPILNSVSLKKTHYHASQPGIFTKNRKILYLPLIPAAPLQDYYHQLLPLIRPHITFEITGFPQDQIPDFLPHITLDYDFTHQIHSNMPALPIELTEPLLLYEQDPGIWKPYVI